jgi:hypothetical protein
MMKQTVSNVEPKNWQLFLVVGLLYRDILLLVHNKYFQKKLVNIRLIFFIRRARRRRGKKRRVKKSSDDFKKIKSI